MNKLKLIWAHSLVIIREYYENTAGLSGLPTTIRAGKEYAKKDASN